MYRWGEMKYGIKEMRAYNVDIKAEDQNDNGIRFTEVVLYPNLSRKLKQCVKEKDREAQAVIQVRLRLPHLKNIEALRSIHVD